MTELFLDHFFALHEGWRLLITAALSGILGVLLSRFGLFLILYHFSRANQYIRDSVKKHLGGRMRSFLPLLLLYTSLFFIELSPSNRTRGSAPGASELGRESMSLTGRGEYGA